MKFEFRQYQEDCAEALFQSTKKPGIRPVVAAPTGSGKTAIMGLFFKKYLEINPDDHLVVLSHTQDILEQDYTALTSMFPYMDIGIYSAGLGQKELGQITVAGIQSVRNNTQLFRWTNLYMVDEVHAVNHKKEGSYRKLLDDSHAIITGMSATVFRSGHGFIHQGTGTLFNKLAYDLTTVKRFNKLVDDGYLCELISVDPKLKLDSSNVKKSGGDYNIKALAVTHNKHRITITAIKEAIKYGKNYSKWLVFAIDIDHANAVNAVLNSFSIKSEVLHSRMDGDRKSVTENFKAGKYRALVSVGMITTGFDDPSIDLILMLRPTESANLHVQMIGRGLRVHPNKDHCLVLDFAGNTERLGPINKVTIPKQGRKGEMGEAPTKTCPVCSIITFAAARKCKVCDHEFEFRQKITATASSAKIMERNESIRTNPRWLKVEGATVTVHNKVGKPPSLKIIYQCGTKFITEWLFPEHVGPAARKAKHVLERRGYTGSMLCDDIANKFDTFNNPKHILVDFSAKFPEIKQTKLQ